MYSKITQKKKNGNKNKDFLPINQYLIDTVDDIQTLPTQISKPIYERCSAGSTAYCIEDQNYYILNNSNEWLVFDESGSGNGNNSNPFSNLARNDVTFYDYDGTIIASYSALDFMELDSLPENPDHTNEGLTAQGWNWTLTDAKNYVNKYGVLNIGQTYVPTDGKTHIFVEFFPEHQIYKIELNFGHTDANGETIINWGDETPTETVSGINRTKLEHTYVNPGAYEITLDTINGIMNVVGNNNYFSQNDTLLGRMIDMENVILLKQIIFSNKIFIGERAFAENHYLQTVSIPKGITSIGTYAFDDCIKLKNIIFPDTITSIGEGAFANCKELQNISFSKNIINIGSSAFGGTINLQAAILPEGIISIQPNTFYNSLLKRICIPEGVTTIKYRAFNNLIDSPQNIIIPESVTSLEAQAFDENRKKIIAFYFKSTTPPTLQDYSVFKNTRALATYIPRGSLESYDNDNLWHDNKPGRFIEIDY